MRIVRRRLRSERSRVRGVHVHVQQRVSGDGIRMYERRRQVRIVRHRLRSERNRVCGVHVHVQQWVSSDGIGMHEPPRPHLQLVQRWALQERRHLHGMFPGAVPTFRHVYRRFLRVDRVHVLEWKPSDGRELSFERSQVRILYRRVLQDHGQQVQPLFK